MLPLPLLLFCPEEPSPEPDEPVPTLAGKPPPDVLPVALDDEVVEDVDEAAVELSEV